MHFLAAKKTHTQVEGLYVRYLLVFKSSQPIFSQSLSGSEIECLVWL